MGLKNDHFAPVRPILRQGIQGDFDFRGMMTVIIDDGNAVCFTFDFQTSLNALYGLQGGFDDIKRNVDFHSHGDAGRSIIDTVNAGKIQIYITQPLASVINVEPAFLRFKFDVSDLKICLGTHTIGRIALFYPGNKILDRLIIQTEDCQTIKRDSVQKF